MGERTAFVVEDCTDTADVLEVMLQSAGFNVRTFSDFHAALKGIREHAPCVVITDASLQNHMDVAEFISHAKRLRRHLPVYLHTGDVRAHRNYRTLGADGSLLKPIDTTAITEIAALFCERH